MMIIYIRMVGKLAALPLLGLVVLAPTLRAEPVEA